MKKKILALVMSCALFASMLPSTVLASIAETDDAQAEDAVITTDATEDVVTSDKLSFDDGSAYEIEIGTDAEIPIDDTAVIEITDEDVFEGNAEFEGDDEQAGEIEGEDEQAEGIESYDEMEADADGDAEGEGEPEAEDEDAEEDAAEDVSYKVETGGVIVEVTAPADALPDGAELVATRFASDSEEYKEAAEAIGLNMEDFSDGAAFLNIVETEDETDVTNTGMAALDISFMLDGEEVEPTEPVKVSIDVSQILPEKADASSIEVQHLVENDYDDEVTPVVVANDSDYTAGTIDEENATAEFEVGSFSTFTVTWTWQDQQSTTPSSVSITVTAYLDGQELEGLDNIEFDSQDDELNLETMLNEEHFGTSDYTFSWAYVTYERTQGPTTTTTTIGSQDDPVEAIEKTSGGQSSFIVVQSSGTTTTVQSSYNLHLYAYYVTPTFSVEITPVAEDDAEDWLLQATLSHAGDYESVSYVWSVTGTDGSETSLAEVEWEDETGRAFIIWDEGVQNFDEVVVHVTATITRADGSTASASASYTLEYGDENVNLQMTYGPNNTALGAGVTVTLTNTVTGQSYEGTTDANGQILGLDIEPGIYLVEASTTIDGSNYSCSETVSMSDAGTYTINLNYADAEKSSSALDSSKTDWNHVDIKLSTGSSDSGVSSEGVTVNITGVVITDSSGNIKYTADSTSIAAGASDNEWQIYFYEGTDTSGSYSHSINFSTTDSITIVYTLQWEDSDEPETYTVTIDASSTYDSGTTYPANGQRAYKLYNYLYGTSYSSNAQLMAAGVDSIDIGGMSMMLVAAILCDSSTVNGAGEVTGTAGMWGMDFALSVEGFVSLSTAWTFDVEKTYENHAMTAGMFTFNLYDASVSGNVWTTSTWEYTWSNSAAGKNIDGNSTDTMAGIYIPYNDDEIQAGTTYYYILYENSGNADFTYYDGTVYGAKVYVHVDEDVTSQTYGEAVVEVTYYTLTSIGNERYYASEYSGEKITLGDNNYPTFHFTNTYTTDVVISKTDIYGNALNDAAFTLTQVVTDPETEEQRTCYYDPSDENGPWIDYTSESDIKSFTMGTIHIATPYDGTYTLTEVTPPSGYTVLPDAITFSVEDGIIVAGSVAWANSSTTENITDYVTLADTGLSLTIADETATGGVQLGVTKTITGRATTAKTFTFALYEADSSFNYNSADDLLKNQSTMGTLYQDDAQSVVFDGEITFSSAGDYYYVILENTESGNGWTCDSTAYHVTVSTEYQNGSIVVTGVSYTYEDSEGQVQQGTLTADENGVYGITGDNTLSFTNTYGVSGQLALSGTKTFTDGTIGENQFGFTLTEQGGTYTETVYADADGNFTFSAINYDYSDIGQHIYIIQEDIPEGATADNNYTLNGVAYDPTEYTVVATVSETSEGTLEVTYTVTADDEAVNNIEFTNYQLGSLNVSKHVVENDTSTVLPSEVPYRVTVTANANEVDFQFVTIMIDGEDVTSSATIDSGTGTITFEIKNGQTVNISGLPLGSYTVEEYVGANDSFEPVYRVGEEETETAPTVDITASSDDSTVTVEIDNEFTVSTSVQVQKSYDGSVYPDEGFTFTIEALSCDLDAEGVSLTAEEMPMPGNTSVTVYDGDAVSFGDITFAHFGTYYYKITETAGTLEYVGYDSSVYYVKIVVGFNEDSGEEYYEETVVESYAKVNGEVEGEGYKDLDYTTVDDIVTAEFTNTYSATGSVAFGGEKKITGKDAETSQQFTFELYTTDSDFTVAEGAEATDTQTVTGTGSFTFKTISYDSDEEGDGAGTYYYVVKETSTDENGWTSDSKEYHITVVVRDAGNGTFALTVTCVDASGQTVILTGTDANGVYNFTGLDFTNEYEPAPTSVQFTGSKYITNSASDSDTTDKVFTFELYNADSSFTADGEAIDTKTTTGAGSITFDEIEYKETGTYYYVIQEKALDTAEGWTIDSKVYNITVEVTDDGVGKLVATVTVNGTVVAGTDNVYGGFVFTNAYAAEGDVTLGVVKSISGVASTDKTFSFTLYNSNESFVTGDSVGDLVETITTDGTITNSTQLNFTAIPYTKAGTYYYVITETGTAPDGWTLDTKEYHVTVTVTDNGDGTLTTSASYAYTDENGETQTENSAAFTNTYAATGSLSLTGKKSFEGGTLTENGFTFTMTDSTGASVGNVTMDASGNITFPTLNYNETDIGGEYTYTITEVAGTESSVQYDETTYTVVVSVADNEDGTLDVTYTVNGTESGDIAFTNYQKGGLTISKSFTGLTDDQISSLTNFTITVTNSDGDTVATLTLDDADEGSSYTWTVSNLPADTYTLTETGYSLDGYEVIAKSGEVTVTDGSDVSVDDTLAWGGDDTVAFTNDYTEVGSLSISKHVVEDENSNVHHLDVGYTVVITAADDDAVDFQWVTITDSTGAIIDFTADTETKTITFKIKNNQILTVNGLPAGKYTVEETVADDSDLFEPVYKVDDKETEGAPTVTVAAGDENVVSVEIENEYPIGTYIQVKKNYNSSVYPQDPNAFTFTIEPLSCDLEPSDVTLTADEMPMPTNSSVTVTDDNAVTFGTMTFEHLGTYYYKITETNGSLNYIDYDSSVYYVKIVVSFIDDSGEEYYVETAEESYCKQDEETEDYKDLTYTPADTIVTAEFTNTYSAEGGVTLTATKDYTGAELTEGQFEFTITETTADATYTGTGTNDVAGNITFTPAIEYTFDDVGTHTYVIAETAGDAGGVTYDSNSITVTVVVTDNNEGTLSTIVTVDGEGVTAGDVGDYNVGTFENSYQATGSVTFGGEKKITGKDEETTQTFTFELYTTDSDFTVGEDATATDTQTVTGAGSFTFKTISYDSDTDNGAGTYYYVVKETSTDENGWTMDTTEYHITVVVTDAGDGTFTIAATCVDADGETVTLTQADDGSYTGLDFTNNYEPAPTSVQFTGSKYITNNASDENKDKEFKFELYSADSSFTTDGDAIDTQTITGAGTITFAKITYDKTGTYYYVINEVQEEAAGWTMSETVYNITVEVTDDGLGQLVATVTEVTKGTVTGTDDVYGGFDFTNAYAAEGEVTLGVVKSISGVASTDKTFSFTLYNSDESFAAGDLIETITTNDTITNSTQLNFTAIPYTKAGTYYYVITETGTAPDGWTLDSTEYQVTVTVTDNGDGTLTTSASYVYTDEEGETQSENSAAFTNTYAATGELALTGTKTFTGGDLTADGFTFTMADSTGASVGNVTMDASGNITFPTLTYDETDIGGEYTYTITEVAGTDSSVQYDETTYTVVVSVADNKDGTLEVTYTVNGTASGDITFTNYQKGSLTISKSFTGLDEDQIASLDGFTITVKSSNGDIVATLTLEDADDDSAYTWTVSDLPAGTYTVTETGYSLDGYEVIAKSGEVTVTDGADVSVNDALAWGGKDTVEFTNDYTEVGTITVSKYVTAEEGIQKDHEDTEYTVVITASENVDFQWVTVTSDSGREITPTIDGRTITFTITEDETITISGLPAGEYTVEEQGSNAMTSEHCVPNYRIGDEDFEEAPTVTVASGEENIVAVEIDNEYPIGTYIMVKKNYNKDEFPEEGFTFTIEALSCDLDAEDVTLTADEMPMPQSTTLTMTGSNVGYIGLITFGGDNEFEHFGTYYYKITETMGSEENIDYDTSVHYIKVVVGYDQDTHIETTDEWEAKADAETTDYKNLEYTEAGGGIVTAEFTNTAYEELSIEKEVSGNAGDTSEYEFEITLTNSDGTPFDGTLTMSSSSDVSPNKFVAFFTGLVKAYASDGTLTFEGGKATVTVTAGETVTIMVPSGVTCTVTEVGSNADSVNVSVNGVYQAQSSTTEATADAGTITDSTQVKFVNSYRRYFPIDEEIVTDEDDIFDKDAWVKDEAVNEYNAIEIEMTTTLPVVTAYDLSNGDFTLNFHEVLDHELVLDEDTADFSVYIGEQAISTAYYRITFDDDTGDDCNFHVDVDLTALYNDGIITEDDLQGDTEITVFFFADLEGTGLNGSYKSTVWYDVMDGDEILYTSDESVVEVYTYEIEIFKYDEETGDALAGATLGVYYDEDCANPVSRNGEAYTETSGEDGYAIFYGLADGTYYVKETEAPTGYVLSEEVLEVVLGEDLNGSGYAYEGSYANTPSTVSVPVEKVWDDSDDAAGIRPTSVEVVLYKNGESTGRVLILNEDNDWSGSFDNLDEYNEGVKNVYTVEEHEVENYTTEITGDAEAGYVVTNTYSEEPEPEPEPTPPPTPEDAMQVTVIKVWEGDDESVRPDSIDITLLKSGEVCDTVTLNEANDWRYTWTDLEMGSYAVKEETVPNPYEVSYLDKWLEVGENAYQMIITNTYHEEWLPEPGPGPASGNPDTGTPDKTNPSKTADADLPILPIAGCFAAIAMIAGVLVYRRKRSI